MVQGQTRLALKSWYVMSRTTVYIFSLKGITINLPSKDSTRYLITESKFTKISNRILTFYKNNWLLTFRNIIVSKNIILHDCTDPIWHNIRLIRNLWNLWWLNQNDEIKFINTFINVHSKRNKHNVLFGCISSNKIEFFTLWRVINKTGII